MDRKEAIKTIECLYPADAPFENTRKVGQRLLDQAKRETEDWRNLPDATLIRYAQLCEKEEYKVFNEAKKKHGTV